MKNARKLLIIFLLFSVAAYAQEKVTINVAYQFKYVRDLAQPDNPYIANMILSVGNKTSRYCSEKCYNDNDPASVKQRAQQQKAQSESSKPMIVVTGGPLLIVNKHGALINEEVDKDFNKQQLKFYSVLGFKNYKIESAIPKIDWQIQPEKKQVGGYSCQKATGKFAGRTYIAWFTTDLPVTDGPWKLSGLPGLILEAADESGQVAFLFKELTKNTDSEETTQTFLKSSYCIAVSQKDYNRVKEQFETDPEAVMSALAPNAKLTVKNIDEPGGQNVQKIKKYNPMELN